MTAKLQALATALKPLANIADAFDANELDDEARKHWGMHGEHTNDTPPEQIELYSGRGGRQLLTLADAMAARTAIATMNGLEEAAKPMAEIIRAYDANELDDEARKFWGDRLQHINSTPIHEIELYSGRGGRQLLTLGQVRDAHVAYLELKHAA